VNAIIRPVVTLLTLPLTILTLGLFILIINAAMLWLAAWISGRLLPDSRFVIDGVLPALVGAIFVSIVSTFLSSVLIAGRSGQRSGLSRPTGCTLSQWVGTAGSENGFAGADEPCAE
jgi:putative membrane protein